MITKLIPRCPCGGKIAPVDGGDHARFDYIRTCRKCRARLAIAVNPAAIVKGGARIHVLDICVL